jgi:hypothetical protein
MKQALNYIVFIIGSLLALVIINDRFTWLASFDYPTSTDGFYYLQEFKSRLLSSRPYYASNSVFFVICTFLGEILDFGPVMLFNVIFVIGLLFLSSSFLVYSLNSHAIYFFPLFLSLVWGSDVIFFRHYAFLKQGFAIGLFCLGFSLFATNIECNIKKILGVILVFIASLCHIFVACLTAFLLLATLFKTKYRRVGLFLLPLILLAVYFLFPQLQSKFIFRNPFESLAFSWPAACSFAKCSSREYLEFIIFSLSSFILLTYFLFNNTYTGYSFLFLLVILILNAPIWTDEGHMSYRLAFSSMWVFLLLVGRCVVDIASFNKLISLIIIPVAFCMSYFLTEGKAYRGNDSLIKSLSQNGEKLSEWLPNNAVILAEHGMQFRVTYFLQRKSAIELKEETQEDNIFILSKTSGFDSCIAVNELSKQNATNCVLIEPNWYLFKEN